MATDRTIPGTGTPQLSRREFLRCLGAGVGLAAVGALLQSDTRVAVAATKLPAVATKKDPQDEIQAKNETLNGAFFTTVVRGGATFYKPSADGKTFQPINVAAENPQWAPFVGRNFPYQIDAYGNNGFVHVTDLRAEGPRRFSGWVNPGDLIGSPQSMESENPTGYSVADLKAHLATGWEVYPFYSETDSTSLQLFYPDFNGNPDLSQGPTRRFNPREQIPLIYINRTGDNNFYQVLTPDAQLVWMPSNRLSGGGSRIRQ